MPEYIRNRQGDEGEGFFCRFTFGQFFALLVLEVLTIFFVFYLGARYGREFLGLDKMAAGVADKQVEESTEAHKPEVSTTADAQAQQLAKELISKAQTPELKERISKMFEAAKTPQVVEVRPPQEKTGDEHGREVSATLPSETEEKEIHSKMPPQDISQVEEKSDEGRQSARAADAATSADASEKSVVRVKSGEGGRYSLQVGSYPKMADATQAVEMWKTKGYSAYMMIADIPDKGRWYRVRLGGFATHEDAARYLKDFQSREDTEALIVMNEQ